MRWAANPRFILPLMFLAWAAWGLYVAHPSITTSWFYDDLHLVRVYTPQELHSTWTGHWDVDRIETPGYRPLTTYFNHFRSLLLGENVVLHRLLLITLFSACLLILSLIAAHFGIPYWQSFLAGLLTLSHQHNWYNLVWVSDGVHALNTLLALISILLFLHYLIKPSLWIAALSLICAALGLLVREDTVALLMVSGLLGTAFLWSRNRATDAPPPPLRAFAAYTLALIALILIHFTIRDLVVPNTGSLIARFSDPLYEWARMLGRALAPFGQIGFLYVGALPSRLLFPILLVVLFAFATSTRDRVVIAACLICVLIATSVGLRSVRSNLLLGAIAFSSFAFVIGLASSAKRSRLATTIATLIFTAALAISSERSQLAQEFVHPDSLGYLVTNSEFLIGRFSHATIPAARRQAALADLARYGISSKSDFDRIYPLLDAAARESHRTRPSPDGTPFLPLIYLSGTQRPPLP